MVASTCTCYLVLKVVTELKYPVAIIGGHVTAQLPPIVIFITKQNSIWSKALLMPFTIWNCVLSYKKNYFSEKWLVVSRNYFRNRIPRLQLVATYIFNRWQMGFSGGKFATC